jgi:hypothetical protein
MRAVIKAGICFLSLLLCIFCTGCSLVDYTYAYDQPYENIVKVEVCQYHYATNPKDAYVTPVMELDLDDAKALLADISALDCHKPFGDHSRTYGAIVLYIHYANGEAEVQGMVNSASVDMDGEWTIKAYYFDSTQWCSALVTYIDLETVPELAPYLE